MPGPHNTLVAFRELQKAGNATLCGEGGEVSCFRHLGHFQQVAGGEFRSDSLGLPGSPGPLHHSGWREQLLQVGAVCVQLAESGARTQDCGRVLGAAA